MMRQIVCLLITGLTFLALPVFAAQYQCTGQEKGINSMTGKERVIPITLQISIVDGKASIKGFDNIVFNVKETPDRYLLKGSIGKSRLMGEYMLQIDKHTGRFKGRSWLLSRHNVDTREGQCERIKDDGHS